MAVKKQKSQISDFTERPSKTKALEKQYAALCYRLTKGGCEVLLITSRGTGRWILPKGWAIKNSSDWQTAASEAQEEAGVKGKVAKKPIGSYYYRKWMQQGLPIECDVTVYPLEVSRLQEDYLEKHERERRWFSQAEAAALVGEPELKKLIANFKP